MRPSTNSAIFSIICWAGLALARSIELPADIESANSTHEASELIDSFVWLDDDLSPYLGAKVPGNNFLSLCAGDHSGDIVSVDKVDLTPNPPIR